MGLSNMHIISVTTGQQCKTSEEGDEASEYDDHGFFLSGEDALEGGKLGVMGVVTPDGSSGMKRSRL